MLPMGAVCGPVQGVLMGMETSGRRRATREYIVSFGSFTTVKSQMAYLCAIVVMSDFALTPSICFWGRLLTTTGTRDRNAEPTFLMESGITKPNSALTTLEKSRLQILEASISPRLTEFTRTRSGTSEVAQTGRPNDLVHFSGPDHVCGDGVQRAVALDAERFNPGPIGLRAGLRAHLSADAVAGPPRLETARSAASSSAV